MGFEQVAEFDQRLRRIRGQPRGLPPVAYGFVIAMLCSIRFAAPEIRDHRLRPEGQRAAEGFDRAIVLAGCQQPIAFRQLELVTAIGAEALVNEGRRDHRHQQHQGRRQPRPGPFHRHSVNGTTGAIRGLSL